MKARRLGVDGCRGGWVFAELPARGLPRLGFRETFGELFAGAPATLAVDMPIGLLSAQRVTSRTADRLARGQLGRRASSVFPPPTRAMLRARRPEPWAARGLSRQSFHLIPKIAEVDGWFERGLPSGVRVHEAHPELAFRDLAGEPLAEPKRLAAGRELRIELLAAALGRPRAELDAVLESFLAEHPRRRLAADDAVDAIVLSLVARDLEAGRARCLPDPPERDGRGREMAIWRPAAPAASEASEGAGRRRPARESRAAAGPPDPRVERILATVDDIPRGRVATYGQVAEQAGLAGRARFVGRVLARHSAQRGLPWWRVLAAAGRPSPGMGADAGRQRALLEAEGVPFGASGRLDWKRCRWEPDP